MPIHGYPGNVITANPTTPTVSSASGVWTTEQQLVNQAAGRWPMAQTQISRSLRFNSADSAYLNRTPASASNRKTWTWSGWVKRSNLGTAVLFSGVSSGNDATILRFTSDQLQLQNFVSGSFNGNLVTTAVYRDVSSWYHIVAVWDSANATSGDRMRLYVNGSEVTVFSTDSAPTQNTDGFINNTNGNYLGVDSGFNNQYFNGYMTEVNFIDGLALDPSYFGFNDSNTGVWTPRQYTGTYGTNGFYLNFSDNSNTTAATLGKDYSGNGNNWTPNNFSVTAGAGNDSMVDSPTSYGTDTGVGGTVRGNYCTWNPLTPAAIAGSSIVTISNGNLDLSFLSQANDLALFSTASLSSGKWYYEFTISATTTNGHGIGASGSSFSQVGGSSYAVYRWQNGTVLVNGSNVATGLSTCTANDVIGIAIDVGAGTIQWFKNNTSLYTATGLTYSAYIPYIIGEGGTGRTFSGSTNFGQRAFAYTAPSGFKALCTQNLPTPTIGATSTTLATQFFAPVIYTGTGATQTVTVGFETGLLWGKERSGADRYWLADQVRGLKTTGYYLLCSNNTDADTSSAAPDGVTAITSTGFTLGANTSNTDGNWSFEINASGSTYVAWNWNAGGSTVTNTSGTISAQVRANTTAGFSVVTFTGNGVAATVGHGLGVKPSMIITKSRSAVADWFVYHTSITATSALVLNSTAASASSVFYWANTEPTSSVFSLYGNGGDTNVNGRTYVAYCFAPVAGYSAFGTYAGNGNADGPFVYTGFRPAYLMIKRSSASGEGWGIYDNKRDPFNITDNVLEANSSAAEISGGTYPIDMVSNGFKIRGINGLVNTSGQNYIYAAFAESPFKYALAR